MDKLFGILFLNLCVTAIAYLLVPAIFCIRNVPMKESKIKKIIIINGIIVWLIFQIIRIEAGESGTSAAVILWSWVGYSMMKKKLLIKGSEENGLGNKYIDFKVSRGHELSDDDEILEECHKQENIQEVCLSDVNDTYGKNGTTFRDLRVESSVPPQLADVKNETVKPAFCRKCGNKLIEGSKFCSKCGAKIAEVYKTLDDAPAEPPESYPFQCELCNRGCKSITYTEIEYKAETRSMHVCRSCLKKYAKDQNTI